MKPLISVAQSAPLDRLWLCPAPTAWGEFWAVISHDGAVASLTFPGDGADERAKQQASEGHPDAVFQGECELGSNARLRRQLEGFVDGRSKQFDLALALGARSEFEISIWRQTVAIEFGHTRSYRDLAIAIAKPGAARAVGGAMGRNPVPLIVPCHRVVRSDGKIGGFSGGPGWKERLLDFESAPGSNS